MTRVSPWVHCAALSLVVALGPAPAASQELPPDVQVDLYLVRAERHIQNRDWAAALEALDIALLLQADQGMETPAELWLTHARAALEAGYPHAAITSATRYLQEAGREGEDYGSALVLLDEALRRTEAEATPGAAPRPAPTRTPAPTPSPREPDPAPPAEPVPAADPARTADPAPAAAADPAPESEPAVASAEAAGGLTVLFPLIGVNAATMAFTTSEAVPIGASQRTGAGGGFGVAFPVAGRFGVQIGAQFAQKGARVTLGAGDAAATADVTFRTVDFTALARISAVSVANLPVYALVGPYASFELDCRVVLNAGAGTGLFAGSNDCVNTQQVDFGVSGGVGLEVGTGETRITVGALYSHGLQDVDKYVGDTAKHRVLNIHAGVARAF